MTNRLAKKKPVTVETFQFKGQPISEWPVWALEAKSKGIIFDVVTFCIGERDKPQLRIKTLEGDHLCDFEDWVIKGVKGELYPCKPDIFELTYDLLGERHDR